ncbi:MAG: hypothetical protein DRG78_00185 [Epsilonproteobacteria bacterium]|nr:MAG: hypothetical protein DRG78_00185 [Campylobacterota bacterium]
MARAKPKKYYWLKLKKDFFLDAKIKKLRRIAGGDTYTCIYLKLMLSTINNDGILIYEGIENTIEKELSLKLDEKVDDINIALSYLSSQNLMIQLDEYNHQLVQVPTMIGSESDSAARVRNHREKHKVLHCNTHVTTSNIEKELELETKSNFSILDKQLLVGLNNKEETQNNFTFLDKKTEKELKNIVDIEDAIASMTSEVVH